MIDTKQAIKDAKRSEYFGDSKLTVLMRLSYRFERSVTHICYLLPAWRKNKIDNKLRILFSMGERVNTPHGTGSVISNYKSIQTDGMGGFVSVDVRYDEEQSERTNYQKVGHYNQIFLERIS